MLKMNDVIRYNWKQLPRCGQVLDVDGDLVIITTNIPDESNDNRTPLVVTYEMAELTDVEVMTEEEDRDEVMEEVMMIELRHIGELIGVVHRRYPHSSLSDICDWLCQ